MRQIPDKWPRTITLPVAIRALSLLVCALAALPAQAFYPTRPIRFIIPSAPGGSADVGSRIIMAEVSKQLGQTVVFDNRPGATGVIGSSLIAKASPDGYTMGQGNIATLAINRSTYATLTYNPDMLLPVVQWTYVPNLVAATLSLPVTTVAQLVEYARSRPGQLFFGSSGNGSSLHVGGELFNQMTGTKIVHVPFKGSAAAITDLAAGRIHLMFDNISSISPHLRSGRVRGLAVTSSGRVPAFPELPTVAESGVPGYEVTAWGGVVVPTGFPKGIIERLNVEINTALAKSDVKEKLTSLGAQVVGGTPEHFAALIRKESAKWAGVVKGAGLSPR